MELKEWEDLVFTGDDDYGIGGGTISFAPPRCGEMSPPLSILVMGEMRFTCELEPDHEEQHSMSFVWEGE